MFLRLSLSCVFVFLFLFFISISANAGLSDQHVTAQQSATKFGSNPDLLQQFTSSGHLTGFKSGGINIVAIDHAVNIKFVDANAVVPISATPASSTEGVQPLNSVTYKNLWDGIDLEYDRGNGIIRSTYTLDPGANPEDIALHYNTEFEIQQNGSLHLNFETGVLTESAPVAWQDINGERLPVEVAFVETSKNRLGFEVGSYDMNQPLIIDPTSAWLTFVGAADSIDKSNAIATDAENNIYISGFSTKKWGTPVGTSDDTGGTLVAKLDSTGTLLWHTFVTAGSVGRAEGIALNGSGDIWITGASTDTWGPNPINDHTRVTNNANYNSDIWVAKLNSSGELQWHTFHGHPPILGASNGGDSSSGIVVDSSGNSYVIGTSLFPWNGNPTVHSGDQSNPNSGTQNIVVFKLDVDGALGWNGFYGAGLSKGASIALVGQGALYVAGYSWNQWGTPKDSICSPNPLCDRGQAIVVKLGLGGNYGWHTYLGKSSSAESVAADSLGNAFISSSATGPIAGEPIRPFTNSNDILVTKLNGRGIKQWHTFLGGTGADLSYAIAVSDQSIYVAGASGVGWGTPLDLDYVGQVMVAELALDGGLRHHTFLGSVESESPRGAAIDTDNNLIITGTSPTVWPETAIIEHTGGTEAEANDIFVRKVDFPVVADIEVLGNNTVISNGDLTPGVGDDTEFGAVAEAGEFTIPRSYTIRSFGTGALLLNGDPIVEISGAHASDFSVTSPPSSPVPTATNTEFTVTFNPTAVGLRTATISIGNNVSDESPYVFSVQGTGNPPLPEIEVRGGGLPSLIDNGSTQARQGSGTQFETLYSEMGGSWTHTFTINNIGTADLTLSGVPIVAISGPDAADYTVTTQPGTPLSGAGTTTFDIKYELATPVPSFEARKATVTIENNDPDEAPFTFSILGLAGSSSSLGGTLSGMAPGNSIVLQNYSSRTFESFELELSTNGVFVFDRRVPENWDYEVTIISFPDNPAQACDVVNGKRTVFGVAEITDIEVNCVPVGYTVGGTASGLEGEGLILQINNGDNLAVTANGDFTFAVGLDEGDAYDVSILSLPTEPEQDCTLTNESGTIAAANVGDVELDCITPDLIMEDSFEEPGDSQDVP